MSPLAIFLTQVLSTWFLVGLIWTIQVVHYPLFGAVGADRFAAYEAAHSRLITLVVAPVMFVELAGAVALVMSRPSQTPAWIAWIGLLLVLIIWFSTAFVQVPAHARLAGGFDVQAHAKLVSTNWIRTVAWTVRGGLMASASWLLLNPSRPG